MFKVLKKASWLLAFPNDLEKSDNYIRIYRFFVVNSPVSGLSARGKDIAKEYGWKKPWSSPYYLNKQLKELTTDKNLLYSASSYEQKKSSTKKVELMDEAIKKANIVVFPETDFERICIYNSKKNQIISTFSHIRNSFAHCRYNVVDKGDERFYCFEDVDPKEDSKGMVKVSARIVLKESSLIKWIELIESGETKYSKNESE